MAAQKKRPRRPINTTSTTTQTCTGCGSVYELTRMHLPMRDKDSIDCGVCGTPLISWNGGCTYTAKLLRRGAKTP